MPRDGLPRRLRRALLLLRVCWVISSLLAMVFRKMSLPLFAGTVSGSSDTVPAKSGRDIFRNTIASKEDITQQTRSRSKALLSRLGKPSLGIRNGAGKSRPLATHPAEIVHGPPFPLGSFTTVMVQLSEELVFRPSRHVQSSQQDLGAAVPFFRSSKQQPYRHALIFRGSRP